MRITSYLKNEQLNLFDVDLDSLKTKGKLYTKNLHFKEKGLTIDSQLAYSDQLCLINTSFYNHQEIEDVFTIEGEYIRIGCITRGSNPLITDLSAIDTVESYPGFLNLVYGKNSRLSITMPKSNQTHYITMVISIKYLEERFAHEKWPKKSRFFKAITSRHKPEGEVNFKVIFPLHQILLDMVSKAWKIEERLDFLELKIREFLLTLYCYEQENQLAYSELNPEVLDKIKKAHYYLETNFRKTPTIKEISRHVLLNELQLKQNFKNVYGTTIRSFIIDLKMKEALHLLKEHKTNEIASMLGYKSLSHFITSFKKHYGSSPKQISKRQLNV
ncbi:helix-turn-helix transcriptional regulator [Fulvivirga sediminis]|uniref:Helix-turn-helix transcriptional regulator n=1 Tax=Fulvivirga sediminis TaxID=2803949 RepID=A0A937K331_9BACT|nr:AraC family transcriptional regulator [Fulvivirga sediminis]MBL3658527.1 helix-turn-helix transcriptional regulator [Fulvivirga sediminis]